MALENFRKQLQAVENSFEHETRAIEVVTELHAGVEDLTRLSDLLTQKQLRYLILKNRVLAHNGITHLIKGLNSSHLWKLDLTNNPIGDRGVSDICKALTYRSGLQELVLEQTGFSSEGVSELAELMRQNKSITALDVSQNAFSVASLKKLVKSILAKNSADEPSQLIKLDLSNTCVASTEEDQIEWCFSIGKLINKCGTLKDLLLLKNQISAAGAINIANGIIKSETSNVAIELLDLSDNPLGDKGICDLASRLIANNTLRDLRVTDVGMQASGFAKLCDAIRNSDILKSLSIGNNDIGEGNAVGPLIKMLYGDSHSNGVTHLRHLDLCGISLSEADVQALGTKLAETPACQLDTLILSHCGITDEGVKAIAHGIKFNMSLRTLDLTSNPFGPIGAEDLAETLRRAKVLHELRISGSRIEAQGQNALAITLLDNREITIKGSASELDYLRDFTHHKGAFKLDEDGEMIGWSHAAWTVVKKGCGAIIGTVLGLLDKDELKVFKKKVLNDRNKVRQTMFECLIRHSEAGVMDTLTFFTSKCSMSLDDYADSLSAENYSLSESTYRVIAKGNAKDPAVKAWAAEANLHLGRYKKAFGGDTHENAEFRRFNAVDMQSGSKGDNVFVQIYHNREDFEREIESREHFHSLLSAGGPFALDDSILKLRETHEDVHVISYSSNLASLSNAMDSLGACAGYDMSATCSLALNCARLLGLINSYGRVHGDFRPKNLMMVAREREGFVNGKLTYLPDKWVLFDFSKSVPHGERVVVREDSAYLPPEVARVMFHKNLHDKQLPKANEAMDVWSFGVVLYQMLTGMHLFHVDVPNDRLYKFEERAELMNWLCLDKEREDLILHRANEGRFYDEASYKMLLENAIDLVTWCLQENPFNRPTFNEILTHPFLKYKRNVSYSNVELLLKWYEGTGKKRTLAESVQGRTHVHIVNCRAKECYDVVEALRGLFRGAGARISTDLMDNQLDTNKQREHVKKARCLVILLTADALFQHGVVQKLLWALDNPETTQVIFLDVSTAGTGAIKFDMETFKDEWMNNVKHSKFDVLVDSLLPYNEVVQTVHIGEGIQKKKQVKELLHGVVLENITSFYKEQMPFRPAPFLADAMVKAIMVKAGFVSKDLIKPYNSGKVKHQIAKEDEVVKVLILHNQDGLDSASVRSAMGNPTLNLRNKMFGINEKSEVIVYNNSFENIPTYEEIIEPHFTMENDMLKANAPTVVLCLVTEGFLALFKDVIVPLSTAKGPVVMKLITYDQFKPSKDEIMNIGLDLASVGDLEIGKTLYPLYSKKHSYEHTACLDNILDKSRYHLSRKILDKSSEFDTYDLPTTIC